MSALEQKVNSGRISDVSLQISDQMPSAFAALVRKHQVPGAQFAIHHGGLSVAHEIGELEFGTGLHVTRDTVFPIGSITKFFTATVAMMLVADGDVDPDAPIRDYVPEMGEPRGDDQPPTVAEPHQRTCGKLRHGREIQLITSALYR